MSKDVSGLAWVKALLGSGREVEGGGGGLSGVGWGVSYSSSLSFPTPKIACSVGLSNRWYFMLRRQSRISNRLYFVNVIAYFIVCTLNEISKKSMKT